MTWTTIITNETDSDDESYGDDDGNRDDNDKSHEAEEKKTIDSFNFEEFFPASTLYFTISRVRCFQL